MADPCLFLLVLTLGLLWLVWLSRQDHSPASAQAPNSRRLPDLCRQERASPIVEMPTRLPIRPWSEVKSHRGAPKHIDTEGFACDNPACVCFGVADAQVHALVGDGTHVKLERIQTIRCRACDSTFSSRRHTPLYRLKTASQRIAEVLAALAEGLDVSAAVRVFGHSEATITSWLRRCRPAR